jgi:hypothetical protein
MNNGKGWAFGLKIKGIASALAIWTLFLSAGLMSAQTSPVSLKGTVASSKDSADDDSIVNQIDSYIEQGWRDFELEPSKTASDGEWCRRVFLDVLGRIPSDVEAIEFIDDKSDDKKKRLVESLLYDDEYTEEFARNWTTVWTNLLIGRTGGTGNNSMVSREGMQKFLRDSFAREKPYDKMCYELVTANGTSTPGDPKFNGAVNFLIDKVNEEQASQATAATTRIFLGLQVQCTQCHNHPFNDWKQQKYWETNAFFRQFRAFRGEMRVRDGGAAELADQDFAGETGRNPHEAEIFYEKRNGLVAVAYPVFVDGTEIERSGYVNVTNRRQEFAKLMIESPYFSKTMANRTWSHFLGYGFTSPVDDLGPHNNASNPALLDYLADKFQESDFDFRRLVYWITLSKPYHLSSESNKTNAEDDPLLGQSPRFSHFYLRQMEAEQLYESLLTATQASQSRGSYEEQERIKSRWLQQFNQAFGNDEGQEATSFNGTIPQVLMMFNGEMVRQAISTSKGSLIDELAGSGKSFPACVEHLFLATLSRKPNGREKSMAKSFLAARKGDAKEALKDISWVLLNTNEFIFNH